jgi:peptidyl-tRNA hydrolase, PTH2 family
MRTKQVIVIRKDLKMRRGKECAQAAHASNLWLLERLKGALGHGLKLSIDDFSEAETDWCDGTYRKIVVTVNGEAHLKELHARARALGLEAHLVTDLGLTEFDGVQTLTALAIGPDSDENVSMVTEGLPLY